jgi:hypothetical protein
MRVRELIAALQKSNPETIVMVPGFDGGFQVAELVHPERLRRAVDDGGYECYATTDGRTDPGSEYLIIEPESGVEADQTKTSS